MTLARQPAHTSSNTSSIQPPDWSEVPQGLIRNVRQNCLKFGRNRQIPVEYRPVLTLVKQNGRWFVLPGTSKPQGDSPYFFRVPAESPDCLTRSTEVRDQFFFAGCEFINMKDCDAQDFGLIQQRLRIALGKWLNQHGRMA